MRKISLAVLLLLLLAFNSYSQTIHWLMFCDTQDPNIGASTGNTRLLYQDFFVDKVNAALAPLGVSEHIIDVYDDEIGYDRCVSEVEGLRCSANDIVVFYYNGHGGRNVDEDEEAHPFPMMCLGGHDRNKLVRLEWVHNQLKAKGARLVVSISDCCNSYASGLSGKGLTYSDGAVVMSKDMVANIQNLFMNYKGDIIATSSKPGQASWNTVVSSENGDFLTDAYTFPFLVHFETDVCEGSADWNRFFNNLNTEIDRKTTGKRSTSGHDMHMIPVSWVNVTKISGGNVAGGNTGGRTTPAPPATPVNSDDDILGNISTILAYVSNSANPLNSRVSYANQFEQKFTSDAVVRIMSEDGRQVIDKEEIGVFLGRIETSKLLLKVIPLSYKLRDGKISELRVKEIYISR